MKLRTTVRIMLISIGILAATTAMAARPGTVTLRGLGGFATMTHGAINRQIEAQRAGFLADTLLEDATWNPLGGAANVGVELDAQVTPVVSVGLGYSAQRGSRRNEAARTFSLDEFGEPAEFEEFEEEPRFSAWDLTGTLGLWVPSAPGLHFGAQLGVVRGTFSSQTAHLFSTFSGEFTEQTWGTWTGTGVVAGAFTGYEQPLSSALSLSTRLGYRYRQVRHPEGMKRTLKLDESEGTSYEWEQGPLLDVQGNPMKLDLGGFYFNVALSVGLSRGE
ncbi:MAG TPA: hypothetical protein VJY35_15580 [Candidatus Eisenbacteria bacterium]|nr:hypothetical protein [Candidatus Eisenbacteria bacterium]